MRLILAALFVPPTGYFVYTRWTAKPALQVSYQNELLDLAMMRPPASDDATAELTAALASLPRLPVLGPPPPAPRGWKWYPSDFTPSTTYDLMEVALQNAWKPDRCYCQGAAVAYLIRPDCTAALDRIAALSSRPFTTSETGNGAPSVAVMQRAAVRLVARARMRMNNGDWRGALSDLDACLNLARNIEAGSTMRTFFTFARTWPTEEAGHLAKEFPLDPEQAEAFRSLWVRHRFDPRAAWATMLAHEYEYALLAIDAQYTGQRGGSGFYAATDLGTGRSPPGGFLRLFSPCYDSRPQMEARYKRVEQWFRTRIDTLKQPVIERWAPTWPQDVWPYPFFQRSPSSALYCWTIRVQQDAAVAAAALSAWRRKHRAYPQSLDRLPGHWRELLLPPEELPDPELALTYSERRGGYELGSEGQPLYFGREDYGWLSHDAKLVEEQR